MRGTSLALGTTVVAVFCCAGLPLLIAGLGGLTLFNVLGLAGIAVAVALTVLALIVRLRRRACAPKPPGVGA